MPAVVPYCCPAQGAQGRIDRSDADLVQVIHSDAGGLGLGVSQSLRLELQTNHRRTFHNHFYSLLLVESPYQCAVLSHFTSSRLRECKSFADVSFAALVEIFV